MKTIMSSENDDIFHDRGDQYGVRRRSRVSVVWSYFEKLDRFKVRCKLCLHKQNYQGTTGNILRHLKNKHNIDATLKGQAQHPEFARRLRAQLAEMDEDKPPPVATINSNDDFDIIVKTEDNEVAIPPRLQREVRAKVLSPSYCEEPDIDPYIETTNFDDYIASDVDRTQKGEQDDQNTPTTSSKRKCQIEDRRILAETEYYREKAAYYRMQKNLIALQAKKIKYELDQMIL